VITFTSENICDSLGVSGGKAETKWIMYGDALRMRDRIRDLEKALEKTLLELHHG
jgi:hypothetical protein